MRLKNIEMQGFKSFADKIYLDFNPGITAIVGPNGSGKSNISDAIRWVMGEQSIKSLRGSKMEDVIFSGTESRKALGFAEVTLVLDNSDNYFNLNFPEITVTRRVYRSGEGEYYINKTLCRLKDIHELFMDTGLGRDGYSIIGQGKIDSVLSTKSEDRRQIFEEAAGISKYKYRKLEAERKLVQTTDNLTRVEDILSELEGQLEPLERQSEKARRYLLLRDEMRGLDINVSVINAENAKKDLNELKNNVELLSEQISGIKQELDKTESEISAMYDKSAEYDQQIENYREADKNTVSLINDQKNQINLLTNDIAHNKQDVERLEQEIETSKEDIERIDGVLEEHLNNLEELNSKCQATTISLDELAEESKKADENVSEKNSLLESIKAEIIELTAKSNAAASAIDNLKILTDSFGERKKIIEEELSGKAKDKDELNALFADNNNKKDEYSTKINECISMIDELENKNSGLNEKISKLAEEQNNLLNKLNQRQARKNMLIDMEREYEGYTKGVKSVMTAYQEGKIGNAKIYGPLAQLIKTKPDYIMAIETALGNANQNIVTKAEEDAKAAISYLKANHLGRATFLPISAVKPRKFDESSVRTLKGYIDVASNLVECDNKYKDIISSFLGNTVVCDNLDNAVVMAKKSGHSFKIVTLDGDVIQPGGAMTGGSAVKTTGSLSRTGEIDSLEKEIAKLKDESRKNDLERNKIEKDIQNNKALILKSDDELKELQKCLIQIESEIQFQSNILDTLESGETQLNSELDTISKRIDEIHLEKKEKEKFIEECIEKCTQLENQAKKAETEFTELSAKNDILIAKLTELNISRNAILKDIELENERISKLNTEKSQILILISGKTEGISQLTARCKEMENESEKLQVDTKNQESSLNNYRDEIETLATNKTELEKSLREKQASIKGIQEQMFSLTQQQTKMESRMEKYETEIESIVNRLLEEYELPYSEAAQMKIPDDFDFKAASVKIRGLREQIRSLGNINIDSIEEYKNVKERFDFLTIQTNDLQKAKKELESVIEEMLGIMKTRFAQQFKIINDNFNKVFSALFGGGTAALYLSDPDNVLESGIEIEAQPPGKKLQSLSLLSGGERAFTAIALLFAILDVRPTPFCILDEIEAALDDVNVYRFADYLKNYSDKTQFIVVTHRRGTMEAANILYGVTMQERGISKLLSLNIDEIQQ